MKPLILTDSFMRDPAENDFADLVLNLAFFDFAWGPQPAPDELAAHLGPRTPSHRHDRATHWSDWGGGQWKRSANRKHRDLSLGEFCQHYEAVELWFDVQPKAQLKLIWLLDYLHAYPEAVRRLKLRLVDLDMHALEKRGRWDPPAVDVTEKELATGSAAWQAWRSPTPLACFDLLRTDLSALPLLKPVLIDLLEELPSGSTGLGASEMRMLELIARGYSLTKRSSTSANCGKRASSANGSTAICWMGLHLARAPTVAGLDEELRTLDRENLRDRHAAYLRSRLSITEFGKAVLAHKEDFSRHNPIDRWWGGTHLTNDNLWRWNPALIKPTLRQTELGTP